MSVPSLSGHAIAYRWRSLPRVRRHGAGSLKGSSKRVLPWQVTMDQLICASLSNTHYWYEVGILKVPAGTICNPVRALTDSQPPPRNWRMHNPCENLQPRVTGPQRPSCGCSVLEAGLRRGWTSRESLTGFSTTRIHSQLTKYVLFHLLFIFQYYKTNNPEKERQMQG